MANRYDNVIVHYINKQEYENALEKVTEIDNENDRCATMLRYSSVFLNNCTEKTVKVLKHDKFKAIDTPKLMPAFMNIHNQKDMKHALEYIETFCCDLK